jgi:hypothetical protein
MQLSDRLLLGHLALHFERRVGDRRIGSREFAHRHRVNWNVRKQRLWVLVGGESGACGRMEISFEIHPASKLFRNGS